MYVQTRQVPLLNPLRRLWDVCLSLQPVCTYCCGDLKPWLFVQLQLLLLQWPHSLLPLRGPSVSRGGWFCQPGLQVQGLDFTMVRTSVMGYGQDILESLDVELSVALVTCNYNSSTFRSPSSPACCLKVPSSAMAGLLLAALPGPKSLFLNLLVGCFMLVCGFLICIY